MAKKSAKKSKKTERSEKKDAEPADESASQPRALWKGPINFGLVSIPVRLVSAIRDTKTHFHRVTEDGKCRLRQKLYCPDTGKEYDFKQTARGYEIAPDQYVIVDPEELDALLPAAEHEIDILKFVALSEIDPIYFQRPYYLLPEKKTGKPYQLLQQVLLKADKVAIAKFVMHDKQHLCAIRASKEILLLVTLYFDKQIVNPESVYESSDTQLAKKELELASELVQSLTDKFHPDEFADTYEQELKKLLTKKEKGAKTIVSKGSKRSEKSPNVVDLVARLKSSLKKNESSSKKRAA